MVKQEQKVKEYWEKQAQLSKDASELEIIDKAASVFKDDQGGTLKDHNLRNLEITSILNHLQDGDKVLDIGCGSGFSTSIFASKKKIDATGIDYSNKMITNAQDRLTKSNLNSLKFSVGDVLHIDFDDNTFNKVVTERCLINLDTWEKQARALKEICRILKPDGVYVMLEGSIQGINNLNSLRKEYGLNKISIVWHNLFFDDEKLKKFALSLFSTVDVENFCSTYMAISRALHPALVAPKEPSYDAEINKLALQMPNHGEYGYLKIWLLKK